MDDLKDLIIPPSAQVTALVLAGGKSSRMGTDKALLLWQDMPLLQRVVLTAQECCSKACVITPWPERYQDLLPGSVQWCVESCQNAGPLVALAQGFQAVETPWVLLLACDMPQLDSTVLRDWISQLPSQDSSVIAYVPYFQSRWEPLCALYSVNCCPSLDAYISSGGRSFQGWLRRVDVVPLWVDDAIAPMLRNCNTPKDLIEN